MSAVPRKPNGKTPHVAHHRALHDRVFGPESMIVSSPTVKASRDPSGRYSLEAVFSGKKSPAQESYFPFKIYKPTNISSFTQGFLFNGAPPVGYVVCNIDSTKPTDLAADPPTVNPKTDAWRFWSVRAGEIDYRLRYNHRPGFARPWSNISDTLPVNGFAIKCPVVKNTDGYTPYPSSSDFPDVGPFENYDIQTKETSFPPLIIGSNGGADGPAGFYQFAFWIKITPDTADNLPGFEIRARDCSQLTQLFPDWSSNAVPIGLVTHYAGLDDIIDQMVFDHIRDRYPPPAGTFGGGSWMNFRGSYDADAAVVNPDDLESQLFYPGDLIYAQGAGHGLGFYQMVDTEPREWVDPFVDIVTWSPLFSL